jgi:DNA repair photolyase
MVDSWFLGRYGMNLYRGCEHGCRFCDGRSERYLVEGDFARDITVKRNAVAVLDRELGRIREPGFVFVGGGVCDAYQPAQARYGLARGALEVARRRGLPVHVLTKSALVERDLDLPDMIPEALPIIGEALA